ncbi:MAG: phosphatidylserine decarboxylase [Verrucomicrobiales bacterium]|nr:phosphatidylserine decarboxylase [Verrucomicrobiales bacterium]
MKERQELVYYDRYGQQLESEGIYGETPLRFAYETALGRICLESAFKRPWFSALYGRWADCSCSKKEVLPFIERFGLDPEEFVDAPESFSSFNEFFSRKLKAEARPVSPGEDDVSFPADGRHLFVPDLSQSGPVYAKGRRFDLPALLGDSKLAKQFAAGSAIISRLCPTDYHRFHFPLDGTPQESRLINGPLYSVNPIALARQLSYLWENKRQITVIEGSPAGDYLFLEIGATNVGSIVSTSQTKQFAPRGTEKGAFRFGGSMVITIFPEGRVQPDDDLATQSADGIELYAKVGDRAGEILA